MTLTRDGFTAISLFSGAGGMDVGFARAGFRSVLACELDRDACETYNSNLSLVGHLGNGIAPSSVLDISLDSLPRDVSVVFGGPPCQGFSVAGKMDPDDERSRLVHSFFDIVDAASPKAFVCENVKNLAVSARWEGVRSDIMRQARRGYRVATLILSAPDYGVPQIRERMFIIGIRKDLFDGKDLALDKELRGALEHQRASAPTVAEVVQAIGRAGTDANPLTCTAKIGFAKAPILRKSAYAGMLFNGAGRPLPARGYATTLPASMGGNKTPIIDEREIFEGVESFVEAYHKELMSGADAKRGEAPRHLRRLTVRECAAIQTFPDGYVFKGSKSSVYRQIGNAVPCRLAEAVARSLISVMKQHGILPASAEAA